MRKLLMLFLVAALAVPQTVVVVKKKAGVTTSYANSGGTGDRTGSITIFATWSYSSGSWSAMVDGDKVTNNFWFSTSDQTDKYIRFDFGTSRVIDEAKFYQQDATSHCTVKWQGSADASAWTDIGGTFTLGGAATQTMTSLSGNTTAYRYYRLYATTGSTSSGPYIYEFEFKIY